MKRFYQARPDTLPGTTICMRTACGNLYVTCNFYQDEDTGLWRLVEVFCALGKAGNCQGGFLNALAISLSTAGRQGVDLLQVGRKFVGIECPQSMPGDRMDPKRVLSCSDAVGKAMLQAWETWNKEDSDGD